MVAVSITPNTADDYLVAQLVLSSVPPLSVADVEHALAIKDGRFLAHRLVDLGLISVQRISDLLLRVSGHKLYDLEAFPIDKAATRLLPRWKAFDLLALPLRQDREVVAVGLGIVLSPSLADGFARHLKLETVKEELNRDILPLWAPWEQLHAMIDKYYGHEISDRSPCAVLGLSEGASLTDIRRSYRRLAKKYHPDLIGGTTPYWECESNRRMREINWAYDRLN